MDDLRFSLVLFGAVADFTSAELPGQFSSLVPSLKPEETDVKSFVCFFFLFMRILFAIVCKARAELRDERFFAASWRSVLVGA